MTSRSSIETGLLEARDYSGWEHLWRGYQEFYRISLSDATTRNTWQRILDKHSPVVGLAARHSGVLVGIAHIVMHQSTWHEASAAYLQDLFVTPEMRGHGVASALIEAATRFAADAAAPRLHWLTHETNESAIRLYERIGKRSGFVQFHRPTGVRT